MKHKKTRSLVASLLLLCILTASLSASALAVKPPMPQPRLTGAFNFNATLTISSMGGAACYAKVTAKSGYTATLSVSLLRDGATIESWSTSGSGALTIDKYYYVSSGHDYQLEATVTVYDSNGNMVDSADESSDKVSF